MELKKSRKSFYTKKVKSLKSTDSRSWWRQLNKLTRQNNEEDIPQVDEIKHLKDEEQVEIIAKHFAKISPFGEARGRFTSQRSTTKFVSRSGGAGPPQ